MEKRLININEASQYLGIPVKSLYNKVSQRTIPFVKIGRRTVFDLFLLDSWIEENTVKEGDFEKAKKW